MNQLGPLEAIVRARGVPFELYALLDASGWPDAAVATTFADRSPPSWRMFLTRGHFHAKLFWLRGVGAYIGSGNLTKSGMVTNLELGVWYDHDELIAEGMDRQLADWLRVLGPRSTEVSSEIAHLLARIQRSHRKELAASRAELAKIDAMLDRKLPRIRGADSPASVARATATSKRRERFIHAFHDGIQVLRKLQTIAAEVGQPDWVDEDVPIAVCVDQATELFYTVEVRDPPESRDMLVEALFERNRRHPDDAARAMFQAWADFDGTQGSWSWHAWANEHPRVLRERLQEGELGGLDADGLTEVISRCHSARTHARQMRKGTLRLPSVGTTPQDQRFEAFSRYLLEQRAADSERDVREVLRFVLWGDAVEPDPAVRIWIATEEPAYKLPHLGVAMLGELLGYVRPDAYPPRNDRVVRSLRALGYEVELV